MIEIIDEAGTLTPAARADLAATPSQFRVRALFVSAPTREALDARVSAAVTSPSTLAIGVDPGHHWTFTHFGVDTGVRSGDYQMVARAGLADFKAGDWAGGAKAIASRAQAVAQQRSSGTPVIVQQPTTVVDHGVSPWPFVIGFGALTLLGYVLYRALRAKGDRIAEAAEDMKREAAEMASKNIEADVTAKFDASLAKHKSKASAKFDASMAKRKASAEKSALPRSTTDEYIERTAHARPRGGLAAPAQRPLNVTNVTYGTAYAPAPVIVRDSSSDMLTGMMIGDAMSRPAGIEREVVVERSYHSSPAPEPAPSSYDSGSSGSSWSDSSSSSSSYDSGGSSGDFGGGGGFDGGGGGGDF